MTNTEWNALRPGDYIRRIRHPDVIYKVTALGPDDEWQDEGEPIIISHQVETIDPFNSRDVADYDPGDSPDYERCQPPKEAAQ